MNGLAFLTDNKNKLKILVIGLLIFTAGIFTGGIFASVFFRQEKDGDNAQTLAKADAVLSVCMDYAAMGEGRMPAGKAYPLVFEPERTVCSKYQEENPRLDMQWEITPAVIKENGDRNVNISLTNHGHTQTWGAWRDNLLVEKLEDGVWYYSISCFPKLSAEDVELCLASGDSVHYAFEITSSFPAGKYRFTAAFTNGISAGYFEIE